MRSEDTHEAVQTGPIRLRQAHLSDWKALAELDQLIFGSYGAQEDPATIRARLAVFPQGCAVLEEQATAVNSATRPTIAGFLTTEKWERLRDPILDEDPHLTHKPHGMVLNITTLAIAPAYQNRGLGVRLVDQAISIARNENCRQIVLETAHAVAFYRRHHFTQIGERIQRDIPLYIMLYELLAER